MYQKDILCDTILLGSSYLWSRSSVRPTGHCRVTVIGWRVADDFHFLSAIRNLLLKHPELGCHWFWLLVGLNIQVPPFGMC